jgi:hypothetical protein
MHPPVFLVRAAHHDPARLIRDSPLQPSLRGELRNVSARDAADATDREAATYWSGAA